MALEKVKSKLNIQKNVGLGILVGVILLGYVFFFSSSVLFSGDKEFVYTELNTPVDVNSECEVTINKWEYCEDTAEMQVVLSYNNASLRTDADYIYQVCSRSNGDKVTYLDFEMAYETSSFAVMRIKEVPRKYNEIAVYVGYGTDEDSEEGDNEFAVLYTNKEKVETVEGFKEENAVTIYISLMENQIEEYKAAIKESENEIQESKDAQNVILEKVSEIKANEAYMTSLDKLDAEEQIKQYQSTYDNYTDTITQAQESIDENNKLIKELEQKISELQNSGKLTNATSESKK